jgi:hypothetical protein
MRSPWLKVNILALSRRLKLRGKLIILLLCLLPYSPILAAPKINIPKVDIETPEAKETPEDNQPELTKEPEGQANPFLDPELEDLVEKQISEDVWDGLKGELPCAIASTDCLNQLQSKALQSSKLLREIDIKVEEATERMEEAKRRNLDSVAISTFSPFMQTFLYSTLGPVSNGVESPVNNPFRLIFGNLASALLGQGLGKLFNWSAIAATDAQQSRSIQIGDLQIKIVELQRNRAEIADKLREKVVKEALKLEGYARNFQIDKEIAKRERQRLEISKISYKFGESDSEKYLAKLSAYDKQKATTWRSWSRLRSQLTIVKILVLGNQDD